MQHQAPKVEPLTSNVQPQFSNPHAQPYRAMQPPMQIQRHRQPQYNNSRPSTSQMQHQAPKVEPSTSNVQPQFSNGPTPNHQFQTTPSISQVQVQMPWQVQYNNQGQMWRPKSDK
ncbi:hypothetical protein V6N11_070685 [Hibiscus sabdariffa]|uniref:Uncharacterized protein n=1 Tax=Hibiscus sabdariffa TaxID=183260 RepID=A0ABR2QFT7_9ROSI